MKNATSPNGKYGVLDTQDNSWMGNDEGPLRYDDEMLARASATIINEQFRTLARFRVKPIKGKNFNVKDEIKASLTATEAIKQIEARAN